MCSRFGVEPENLMTDIWPVSGERRVWRHELETHFEFFLRGHLGVIDVEHRSQAEGCDAGIVDPSVSLISPSASI
jgi:hypothetical protein